MSLLWNTALQEALCIFINRCTIKMENWRKKNIGNIGKFDSISRIFRCQTTKYRNKSTALHLYIFISLEVGIRFMAHGILFSAQNGTKASLLKALALWYVFLYTLHIYIFSSLYMKLIFLLYCRVRTDNNNDKPSKLCFVFRLRVFYGEFIHRIPHRKALH